MRYCVRINLVFVCEIGGGFALAGLQHTRAEAGSLLLSQLFLPSLTIKMDQRLKRFWELGAANSDRFMKSSIAFHPRAFTIKRMFPWKISWVEE
jgi:hypothetical protein